MRSIPHGYKGRTIGFDGLRITGGPSWINFVLSRLKDVLAYDTEGGETRVQTIYKQLVDNKTQQPLPQSFAFYLQIQGRDISPKLNRSNRIVGS